jgi:hypothetical protein
MKRLLVALLLLLVPPSAFGLGEDVPFVVTPGQRDARDAEARERRPQGLRDRPRIRRRPHRDRRRETLRGSRPRRGDRPDLVRQSNENAKQAGVADRAEFREEDLFKTDMSRATVITMYLLPEVNLQAASEDPRPRPGTRIVSHDWDMGD